MSKLEQITTDALTLEPTERIRLAQSLWASVEDDDLPGMPEAERKELIHDLIDSLAPADADAEAAWSAEIQRRIEDVEQGRVECVSFEDALANARRAIGCDK